MNKKIFLGTLAAILSLTMATAEAQPRMQEKLTEEEQLLDAMHRTITSEKLFGYVKQLSDPALEGRLAGSPGMAKAVEIVKGYYEAWGLQPAGDKKRYRKRCVAAEARQPLLATAAISGCRAMLW